MFRIWFRLLLLLHFCNLTWFDRILSFGLIYNVSFAYLMFVAVIKSFLSVPLHSFTAVIAFWNNFLFLK
jgi:hypothetical protein